MKRIEIVTHVYAKVLPHYAQALVYQLSSVVLYPPTKVNVSFVLCYDPSDKRTKDVIDFFSDKVDIRTVELGICRLGRRAIGRNIVAKQTKADIVWFADADYLFREGCLDSLAEVDCFGNDCAMVVPSQIHASMSCAIGDELLQFIGRVPRIIDVDVEKFKRKRRIITPGGLFIVDGNFARKHGYIPKNEKRQKPTDGVFVTCRCDKYFKGQVKMVGVKRVIIPEIYHINHTLRTKRLNDK